MQIKKTEHKENAERRITKFQSKNYEVVVNEWKAPPEIKMVTARSFDGLSPIITVTEKSYNIAYEPGTSFTNGQKEKVMSSLDEAFDLAEHLSDSWESI